MDTNTTRRNLLRVGTTAAAYAAGATIVTGGVALATRAKSAAPAVSPALSKLLHDFDAADQRLDHFYKTVHNPAVDRDHELRAAHPEIEHEIPMTDGYSRTFSTARSMDVAQARHLATSAISAACVQPAWVEKRKAARSFYAAHLRRERAFARIRRMIRLDAINAQETALFVPYKVARDGIEAFPIASAADLDAKLSHMERTGASEDDDVFARIAADVRRLASQEGC
jgi:hypothetical protein